MSDDEKALAGRTEVCRCTECLCFRETRRAGWICGLCKGGKCPGDPRPYPVGGEFWNRRRVSR